MGQGGINYGGLVWLTLVSLAALPVYWFGIVSLGHAWVTPEYSHGPLIPLISLYLFMRELRDLPEIEDDSPPNRLPGILLIVFALGLGVFGNLVRIPDIVAYALILWFGGLLLVGLGWKRGKRHWAPVVHLVFMLPLPQFIYWQLSTFLQAISSELGVWFVKLAGVPVLLEGNIIDLGVYKLQVAEACSGLRYLFPILSFSYLFGILYRGPFWHKATLFIMAAPLTVFMNSFRIGIIGVLVDSYGIGQAEGFLHFFEGWVIFGSCIGILFITAILLQDLTPNPKPLSEAIDLDTNGMAPHFASLLHIVPGRHHVISCVATAAITSLFFLFPASKPINVERETFASFPEQINGWTGSKTPFEPEILEVLAADDVISITYLNAAGTDQINLFSAWYKKQTEGQAIHSPEVCLPAGGWEVFSITPTEITIPNTVYGTFNVNRAIIQKGSQRQLVYYWFEQRGERMTNDFLVKISVMRDTFTRGRGDGAIVRLVMPLAKDADEAEADKRLQAFMQDVLEHMPRYIPE